MSQNVVYVGIDVDDVQYHGSRCLGRPERCWIFAVVPLKGLVGQLEKAREYYGGAQLKLCYEASYVGFSLQRDLLRSRQLPFLARPFLARRIR